MKENNIFIFGKHTVIEALTYRPDIVTCVHLTDETHDELRKSNKLGSITVKPLNPKKLPGGHDTSTVHQGFFAEIDTEKLMVSYDDFMNTYNVTNDSAFVVLGEIQDPHNVGAIIRSATAFGIAGVLIPEHRQAQISGTVAKVSVGTVFRTPLIRIGNVNQTIEDLKKRGFWSYGLEADAKQSVVTEGFEKPSVFVLGNEADGVRKKTLEHCDIPLRIPMSQDAESLNVSTSAAVVLYAWSVKHPKATS